MKKTFTTALLAAFALALPAAAQSQLPEALDGFYRLTNPGFQEALTAKAPYELGGTIPSVSNAGSVFKIKTGEMWNFAVEMGKLQAMLEAGEITQAEYTQMFMNLMNVNSWKGGFFPLTELTVQGEDLIQLANKLPDYADAAIEYFLNNDAANIYKEKRSTLTMLCVFASDIITPANLETEATFLSWCEKYLTRCRQVADFGIYLHPIYTSPQDETTASEFTGSYYIEFKTPPYVGSMEKAQIYINNMESDNGQNPDAEKMDIWASAKSYIMDEMAHDYPVDSPEYKLVEQILGPTQMNTLYIIGEGEDGGLSLLMLPDAFNTQEVTITADDLARCTWDFDQLTEENPFAVIPEKSITDSEGRFYTGFNSPFPFRLLSPGMEAYYATSVDAATGVPTLVKITGDIVPAETPVIISGTGTEAADNKVMPLDEASVTVEGNVLKGVIFSEPNGRFGMLGASSEGPVFNSAPDIIPANSIYYDGELTGVTAIGADNAELKIYDLLGREVKNPAKGIYIVNGNKMVR